MRRLLIQNPLCVAAMDSVRSEWNGGHILIEEGDIVSAGPEPYPQAVESTIDASGMVVLPGFVNTHHHLFQSLTRAIRRMQDGALFDWLTAHYEIWRELTESGMRAGSTTALLEMMKSGVTTSADHHYLFPKREDGKMIDIEIEVARSLGIRFHPTRGSMTLGSSHGGLPPDDVVQTEEEISEDTERLLERYHDPTPGSMVRIAVAPCAAFNVTREQMRRTAEFARRRGLRMHTHLAETKDEEEYCRMHFRMRPVEYAEAHGWLNEHAWFAHAIHLNEDEIKRLGEARVGISHCPSSNMRLGSGIAPVKELLQAGAEIGLGVDGSASNDSGNFLHEIRQAMLISRLRERSSWLTARDVLWMATRGGAKVLGRDDIGSIEKRKRADVAIFSVRGIEYAGALSDPLAALVFCTRNSPVDHLIINGERVISDGRSRVDEERIAAEHNRLSAEMLERASRQTGIDFTRSRD